jgi:hypothetical protein
METFLNSYNLSMDIEAFLGNGYDDLKQLNRNDWRMLNYSLQDVVADVNVTMKGHVRLFLVLQLRKALWKTFQH